MNITMQPFYWQTATFRTVVIVLFTAVTSAAVWQITRLRARQKIERLQREHVVEQERARIARDMHDELGSRLFKAGMVANRVARGVNPDSPVQQGLKTLRDTVDEMTASMDELVWVVNPRHDTLNGLANYLVHHTQEFLAETDLKYQLDVPPDLPAVKLSSPVRHNLFMAFKEALRNCARHACARNVRVSLRVADGTLRIEVTDDGCGFVPGTARELARGLENMRERLTLVGGACLIESAQGRGTRVILETPVTLP